MEDLAVYARIVSKEASRAKKGSLMAQAAIGSQGLGVPEDFIEASKLEGFWFLLRNKKAYEN